MNSTCQPGKSTNSVQSLAKDYISGVSTARDNNNQRQQIITGATIMTARADRNRRSLVLETNARVFDSKMVIGRFVSKRNEHTKNDLFI